MGVPTALKETGVLWMIIPDTTAAIAGKPKPTIKGTVTAAGVLETSCTLDERPEQPGDQNDLHPTVG